MKIRKKELDRLVQGYNEEDSKKLMKLANKVEIEANKIAVISHQRQLELENLISQVTMFLNNKTAVETWLTEGKKLLENAETPTKLDEQQLQIELEVIERLFSELPEMKEKMEILNNMGPEMIKKYKNDECHRMSHGLSTINFLWTKFNDK